MDINVLVCDDNKYQLNNLVKIIQSFSEKFNHNINMDIASDSNKALKLHSENKYHIAFLDIEIDDISGIEIAKKIRDIDDKIIIIFVTGFPDFTREAYKLFAYNYILKPIDVAFFEKMMNRALDLVKMRFFIKENLSLLIKDKNRSYKIHYDDIVYAEKLGKKVIINLTDGTKMYFVMTLNNLEADLDSEYFIRCHKGYIISKSKIKTAYPNELFLEGYQNPIPIGRKYKEIINKIIFVLL